MPDKAPLKITSILAAFLAASTAFATTSDVVGYTTTTLPGGAGNIFAPAFVNADSFAGAISEASSGATSTLTVSGTLSSGAFDETTDVSFVSKGYPQYYVEVLNDTNAGDGLDTEGLIIDIVSNTDTAVVVGVDTSSLGVQGDEDIAIRKHITLASLFANSTGLTAYTDVITIYNEDGAGTAVSHLPDGTGGFVSNADFTTVTSDAPVYPGTGFVINNPSAVTITPVGTVKESDTQVVIYGGSVVNIVSCLKPVSSFDMASDGRLGDALGDYTDVCTPYSTDGSLTAGTSFLDNGANAFVSGVDFFTPVTANVDGTSDALVVSAGSGTVYKASGNSL